MTKQCWIAVASADHVAHGLQQGIMQVCHGKQAPLRRIHAGDCVVYYSPKQTFAGKNKLQAFTAIGIVKAGEPYLFAMGEGFTPYRRDVHWLESTPAPIAPLLPKLSFTEGKDSWGYSFRFGLFSITKDDIKIIAAAMKSNISILESK